MLAQMRGFRAGRLYLPIVGFLLAFWVILFLVTDHYLLPAIMAAHHADALARRQIAAISSLVLAIILSSLVALLLLAIRPGRFFQPRKRSPRSRTRYVDAWAESAHRMKMPPDDQHE